VPESEVGCASQPASQPAGTHQAICPSSFLMNPFPLLPVTAVPSVYPHNGSLNYFFPSLSEFLQQGGYYCHVEIFKQFEVMLLVERKRYRKDKKCVQNLVGKTEIEGANLKT
jgi:hypothetical protein